ncbi:MAG: sigma-70 family RNA polymerase sigma factor [Candidatus Hydrogenedentes bacterium]|nr:sigma-70 family RNA polymerase sigma factor [Candidatus Hydrogenedentota bacterium]
MPMTDSELVSAILQGQTTQFEKLVDRYLPMVRGLCASRFRDPATVDDLTQEALIAGYRNLNRLRNPARFAPWLARIARNACVEHLRSTSRRTSAIDRAAAEVEAAPATPDEIAQRKELYAWVHRAIGTLPDKTREVMVLHYMEGLSTVEIAAQTGIREAAVRKRLQYGRQLVGEALWKELEPHRAMARPETENAKRRVLKALPLAAAPWLVNGGNAAAATGITGLLGSSATLKLGLTACIAALGLAVIYALMRPPGAANEVAVSSQSAGVSNSNINATDSPPVSEAPSRSEAPASPSSERATGSLTVQVNFKDTQPAPVERTNTGVAARTNAFQPPRDSGQPVPEALVRIIPLTFDSDGLLRALERAGIETGMRDRVVQCIRSIFEQKMAFSQAVSQEEARARMEQSLVDAGLTQADFTQVMDKLQTVLAEESGGGMDIFLKPGPASHWHEAPVDATGCVHFTQLPAGHYLAVARDPQAGKDWPPDMGSSLQALDGNGMSFGEAGVSEGKDIVVTVILDDARSALRGFVIDAATGEAIPKARVLVASVELPGLEDSAVCNDEGGYWVLPRRVGYGTLHVRVEADNYQPAEFNEERALAETLEQRVVALTPKANICGKVLTFDGKPAAEVRIVRWSGDSGETAATSREDGTYCLGHDGGRIALSASVGPLNSERITLDLAPDEAGTADFVLPPAGSIVVRVSTASGVPVTALDNVSLFDRETGRREYQYLDLSSESGEYLFQHIRPGDYTADSMVKGLEAMVIDTIPVEAGRTSGPLYVSLNAARIDLSVRVQDRDGAPRPRYFFWLQRVVVLQADLDDDGHYMLDQIGNVRTDGEGEYAFSGLVPGLYEVQIMNGKARVQVPHAGVLVVQEEEPQEAFSSPTLHLGVAPYRVVKGERVPVHEGQSETFFVPLALADAHELDMHAMDGALITEPGTYCAFYIKPGETTAIKRVEITSSDFERYANKQLLIEVEVGKGGGIEGSVVHADGSPWPGREIRVLPLEVWDLVESGEIAATHLRHIATTLARSVQSDDAGRFKLDLLPAGPYAVGVSEEAMAGPIEVVQGQVTGPVVIVDSDGSD